MTKMIELYRRSLVLLDRGPCEETTIRGSWLPYTAKTSVMRTVQHDYLKVEQADDLLTVYFRGERVLRIRGKQVIGASLGLVDHCLDLVRKMMVLEDLADV